MRINVNAYNEILSYEGTPEELAEFVATGIFGEWVPADEDCGCDNVEMGEVTSYTVPDEFDEDGTTDTVNVNIPEIELPESFDPADHKAEVRQGLRERGIELSDEEFEKYYNLSVDLVNLFDSLLNS